MPTHLLRPIPPSVLSALTCLRRAADIPPSCLNDADGATARRDREAAAVVAGDESARARQATNAQRKHDQDIERLATERRERDARIANGVARSPAEAARILDETERRLEQAHRVQTRADDGAKAQLEASIVQQRRDLHVCRARAREATMWSPLTFHNSQPTRLHRSQELGQIHAPSRLTTHMCYVPTELAVTYGYRNKRRRVSPTDAFGASTSRDAASSFVADGAADDGDPPSDDEAPVAGTGTDAPADASTAMGDGAGGSADGEHTTQSGRRRARGPRTLVYVASDAADPYEANDGRPVPLHHTDEVGEAVRTLRSFAKAHNTTWFTQLERDNPIHFWEQRLRCNFCGRDHFVVATSMHLRCCHAGACVLHRDHALSDIHIDLIARDNGCSSASRALNMQRRLVAQALAAGEHWTPDQGGGLKITGLPYALVRNVRERSAARAYLEDPDMRVDESLSLAADVVTQPRLLSTFNHVLWGNPLYEVLREWHDEPFEDAHLVVQWGGTTSGVRAFTSTPACVYAYPRSVVVFSRAEVDRRKFILKPTCDLYPALMWPLAFPHGGRLLFDNSDPVDDWLRPGGRADQRNLTLQQSTLFLLLQPERRSTTRDARASDAKPGAFVYVKTLNPYKLPFAGDVDRPPFIMRRFNRFALMGKLADEFVLDRFLSVMDHRRDMLSLPSLQRRLTAQVVVPSQDGDEDADMDFAADAADAGLPTSMDTDRGMDDPDADPECDADGVDAGDAEYDAVRPTYMPATEAGSERSQMEKTSDALYLAYKYGGPLFFTTMTFNPEWPEVRTQLPMWDPMWTDRSRDPFVHEPPGWGRLPDGGPHQTQQQVYEATALHAEVFEHKYAAFTAVMQSGTIFRNVGRPRVVGYREEHVGEGAPPRRIPQYEYPLSIHRDDDSGAQGYDIHAIEYQRRTFTHGHKATRPTNVPSEWNMTDVQGGQRLDWIDQLTCARIPRREVLLEFGMLGRAGDWRHLDGVVTERGGLHRGYEYLATTLSTSYDDEDLVVHPDIVHDFGATFEDPNVLLNFLTLNVSRRRRHRRDRGRRRRRRGRLLRDSLGIGRRSLRRRLRRLGLRRLGRRRRLLHGIRRRRCQGRVDLHRHKSGRGRRRRGRTPACVVCRGGRACARATRCARVSLSTTETSRRGMMMRMHMHAQAGARDVARTVLGRLRIGRVDGGRRRRRVRDVGVHHDFAPGIVACSRAVGSTREAVSRSGDGNERTRRAQTDRRHCSTRRGVACSSASERRRPRRRAALPSART